MIGSTIWTTDGRAWDSRLTSDEIIEKLMVSSTWVKLGSRWFIVKNIVAFSDVQKV